MSLLDDVSIVVTPNGYKAGTLFGAIPVPTFGSDEITCGDFECANPAAVWSTGGGWSIGGGVATANGNANSNISQNIPLTVGNAYSVTYTVVNSSVGSRIGIAPQGTTIQIIRTADGTYTETFTAATSSFYIRSLWNNGSPVSVDNVSVKEWVGADMDVTRGTDATRVDENGLVEDVLANVPRIDYTGGGCPHILAEPMRTNLVTYSDFSDFSTIGDSVITLNNSISPDGTNNATNVTFTTGRIDETVLSFTDNTDYTFSFWAKKGGALTTATCFVKINSGSNISQQITLTDNWQKFSLTANSLTGSSVNTIGFRDEATDIELFGAQLEEGSYPTSLIPTSGSTVTRNQDIFTRDGIGSLINSTEGVLFVEMAALTITNSSNAAISVSDGSTTNRIFMYYSAVTNAIKFQAIVGGSTAAFMQYTLTDITIQQKIAFKWDGTTFSVFIDGDLKGSDDRGLSFLSGTLNTLGLNRGSAAEYFVGKVKQLQVYKTALTDPELIALTS